MILLNGIFDFREDAFVQKKNIVDVGSEAFAKIFKLHIRLGGVPDAVITGCAIAS